MLSLETAKEIQHHAKGPVNQAKLKKFLNSPSNFRMVNRRTNRDQHHKLDQSIIAKSGTSILLTKKEEHRGKQILSPILTHAKDCPRGFRNAAMDTFKRCKTQNGTTLWAKYGGRHR